MTPPLAKVVDTHALWTTSWTAAVAGIGISLVFAITIVGATRSSDMRREDRPVPATLFALLAVLGTVAALGAVVFGVTLITA